MDEAMFIAQLRDIRGLDGVSWWPPAPGWWLALLGLFLLGLLLWQIIRYFQRDWRDDARRQLKALRKRLGRDPGKEVLLEFSELMRRIAMARYRREDCAGLFGTDWLEWLQDHDPRRFDWPGQADLLLNFAYAPPDTQVDPARLRKLIRAARAWVDAELPAEAGESARGRYFTKWFRPGSWQRKLPAPPG